MSELKQMLIQFNSKGNSNKFYYAEVQDDGDTVLVRYGRVGSKGTETRYSGGQPKFDSLLRSKRSKGYKYAMMEATVNDEGVSVQTNVIDTALMEINYKDDAAKELVKSISAQNVHKITNATSIKFNAVDGLFRTPLGVVEQMFVEQAIRLLAQIEEELPKFLKLYEKEPEADLGFKKRGRKRKTGGQVTNEPSAELKAVAKLILQLNEAYFIIIPNKVENACEIENLLFSQRAIDEQKATCNALLETLALIDDLKMIKLEEMKSKKDSDEQPKDDAPPTFEVEIETVDDKKIIKYVSDLFESTKNSDHGSVNNGAKVGRVYKIKLALQQAPFEECTKELGDVQHLWHGTYTQNLLSIMSKGLLLPKLSPGQKVGAMFGDGLYFANQSTKSLSYCDGGFWTGNAQSKPKVYMFLASVAMGKYFVPRGPTSSPPPEGYDSYWAKAGESGVINDELIIFKAGQSRLDYLLEIVF